MFAVELPVGGTVTPHEAPAPPVFVSSLRIAVVDDNDYVREALSTALQLFGHKVVAGSSGSELLAELGDQQPDLIIADYRLADDETGYDVIASARRLWGDDLPAFVITGDTDPALVRSMADRGVAVYYKPLAPELLPIYIHQAMEPN